MVSFSAYLTLIPIVLSIFNIALFPTGVLIGFSGVLMAFIGFLPIAIVWYGHAVAGINAKINHSLGLFFLGLAIITVWFASGLFMQLLVTGITLVIVFAYASGVTGRVDVTTVRWPSNTGYPELGATGVVVFALGLFAGFQSVPVVDGTIINYHGHFIGYAIGFIPAYIVVRTAS